MLLSGESSGGRSTRKRFLTGGGFPVADEERDRYTTVIWKSASQPNAVQCLLTGVDIDSMIERMWENVGDGLA